MPEPARSRKTHPATSVTLIANVVAVCAAVAAKVAQKLGLISDAQFNIAMVVLVAFLMLTVIPCAVMLFLAPYRKIADTRQ